jgi:hypothetical protein
MRKELHPVRDRSLRCAAFLKYLVYLNKFGVIMPVSFRLPFYQKTTRDQSGVSGDVSGAQLYQLQKAASRGDLNGLSKQQNKRQAQLYARKQTNVDASVLSKYAHCDAKGNVTFTREGQALIKKDKREKTILGAVRAFAFPTVIGAPLVHEAYQARRDVDKHAATEVTPALRERIGQDVWKAVEVTKEEGKGNTYWVREETVKKLMDKYGLSEHDVITFSVNNSFAPKIRRTPEALSKDSPQS